MFENKRGQVTIFIIIAILVVAIGLIVYFFFPRAKTTISTQEDSPISYFQNCISDKIESTTETVSLQGGSFDVNFSNSYLYQGHYIKYLCYTKDNFKPCVNQEPFLEEHIESEILKEIQSEVEFCLILLRKVI